MVVVCSLAARIAGVAEETITSTLRRTRSATKPDKRSNFPSAHRYSITTFSPSTYPKSRSPCTNAWARCPVVAGDPGSTKPIRGTFFGCCASAVTATAISTAKNRIDTTRAFFIAHTFVMYHAGCIRGKLRFTTEGDRYSSSGKTRFSVRLN